MGMYSPDRRVRHLRDGLILFALGFGINFSQADNIILFIGDGMGFEQVKAARYYQGSGLSFEAFDQAS